MVLFVCFTFSPAQWASPQLNGPVQHCVYKLDWDSSLTGPWWSKGSRRKKTSQPETSPHVRHQHRIWVVQRLQNFLQELQSFPPQNRLSAGLGAEKRNVKMWRSEMWRCEDMKLWRCEDVRNEDLRCEATKMWRAEMWGSEKWRYEK